MCRASTHYRRRGFYQRGVTLFIFDQFFINPIKVYILFSGISYNLRIQSSKNFSFFLLLSVPPCFSVIRYETATNFSTLAFCKTFRWPNIGYNIALFASVITLVCIYNFKCNSFIYYKCIYIYTCMHKYIYIYIVYLYMVIYGHMVYGHMVYLYTIQSMWWKCRI